jgi:hypothetical protein
MEERASARDEVVAILRPADGGPAPGPGAVKEGTRLRGNVICVLENVVTGEKKVTRHENIITNSGEIHFAELLHKGKDSGQAMSNTFTHLYISSATTPAGGPAKTDTFAWLATGVATAQAVEAGYPKQDDAGSPTNPDNPTAGVDNFTYKYFYATTAPVSHSGAITVNRLGISNTGASGTADMLQLLTVTPAIGKTANDTLTVYINFSIS